jgi:2,4-dienoyl-CoA reductase-like NADH-dependent reductase (Old Yellow Enzyme family)
VTAAVPAELSHVTHSGNAKVHSPVRFGVIEYDGCDEETLAESIRLIKLFKQAGVDLISVSIGFSTVDAEIPWGPAFMAPVAERIRREAEVPVAIAWGLGTPELADNAVRSGQADLVEVGRALLANPHWPYAAATKLGVDNPAWATPPAPYAHWLEGYQPESAVVPA